MTNDDFKNLPWLLLEHQVILLGYSRATVEKFLDCGVLTKVQPPGCGHRRFQKRQLAALLGLQDLNAAAAAKFAAEPLLLRSKVVQEWTGMSEKTLIEITGAKGLRLVKPAGSHEGKYLKDQIGRLLGF